MSRVISFDPGTVSTGWSLRIDNKIVECGKIQCPSSWKQSKRLGHLLKETMSLLCRLNPDRVAIEQQHVGKNAQTSLITARAMGIIIAVAGAGGISCSVRQPSEIKKSATGKGNSSKEDVANAILLTYKDNPVIQNIGTFVSEGVNKTDDIYDAVAINHDDLTMGAGKEI